MTKNYGMLIRFTPKLNRESIWDLRLPNEGVDMSYDYLEGGVGMRYGLLSGGFFDMCTTTL